MFKFSPPGRVNSSVGERAHSGSVVRRQKSVHSDPIPGESVNKIQHVFRFLFVHIHIYV
jgi:hypothetical protein